MNEVFLDSAYAIALSSSTDRHHVKAVKIAKELEQEEKTNGYDSCYCFRYSKHCKNVCR